MPIVVPPFASQGSHPETVREHQMVSDADGERPVA